MNVWHEIPPDLVTPRLFDALIEIPKGSKTKYELDKRTGLLRLDRILYTSTVYPANYGFIPLTYAADGDPLDVLVLSAEPVLPMTLVSCSPIGVIKMDDGGKSDEKIIAVAVGDPTYRSCKSLKDLPSHVFEEMSHFFEVYKTLENKHTAVKRIGGVEEARLVIADCIKAYAEKFPR